MQGIEMARILVKAGARGGSAFGRAYEDGKISYDDMRELWNVLQVLKDLAKIDFARLKKETLDIDQKEMGILIAEGAAEFDLPDDEAELLVEGYLQHGLKLALCIKEMIDYHNEEGLGAYE